MLGADWGSNAAPIHSLSPKSVPDGPFPTRRGFVPEATRRRHHGLSVDTLYSCKHGEDNLLPHSHSNAAPLEFREVS